MLDNSKTFSDSRQQKVSPLLSRIKSTKSTGLLEIFSIKLYY